MFVGRKDILDRLEGLWRKNTPGEVNGTAFTVTAAEALECAPLQMMVNFYPSPFVIIIR